MKYSDNFDRLSEALEGAGAFLVVEDKKGRVNVMTIGWAQAGFIWGQPIMSVLVRPSRHTHSMQENAPYFTVCVPRRGEMKKELGFCGTKSGRDYDKIRACAMKLKDGMVKGLKYIEGCGLVYQCEVYGKTSLGRENISAEALEKFYPEGDFHTLYFGKILKADNFL
ncbi:MAG: hypothetical protein AUJ51_10900 [Elusimicrobia bacterium CG1_02_56_21]|nr:MAG: hypothetical protein AUJ51_10900 [Elusimicrobia bacterium CG1_02_56_21]